MSQVDRHKDRQEVPIILTAFGTTAKAFSTYEKMDAVFKEEFPNLNIIWTYSSRMVKYALKKDKNLDLKDPGEVLSELQNRGCQWAVLQSLHLIGGHELHRLAAERNQVDMRLSLGLPLLSSPRDYQEVAKALAPVVQKNEDEAVVVVGHGTDHPSWTSYFALEAIMRKEYGPRVFSGVVEGFPEMEETLDRILKRGFKKVRIIPLMLVAGVHFIEDLTQEEDSWQKTFEAKGLEVSVVPHGVGHLDGVTRVFCRHISEALDVIPL
ncbi:sirohydrochlorin cobaltochelatase [Desulfocicer vacuolatum DSM 3385]|uniref:Sirohydrochlorin cobaltochelatase n=1 Tax=Desulfocicer vacuolatum DSM 3385 TaxID=1121400 RepID=A0A1W2E5V9_9BACT|nr:sirohydrochlorin cobaltochelatase [Desulfocicer vacuolatum]SMD05134.1 sirohydrochlorin cobaltochelatase [Desulfocicer vacuolatum DSM 3385]